MVFIDPLVRGGWSVMNLPVHARRLQDQQCEPGLLLGPEHVFDREVALELSGLQKYTLVSMTISSGVSIKSS